MSEKNTTFIRAIKKSAKSGASLTGKYKLRKRFANIQERVAVLHLRIGTIVPTELHTEEVYGIPKKNGTPKKRSWDGCALQVLFFRSATYIGWICFSSVLSKTF